MTSACCANSDTSANKQSGWRRLTTAGANPTLEPRACERHLNEIYRKLGNLDRPRFGRHVLAVVVDCCISELAP